MIFLLRLKLRARRLASGTLVTVFWLLELRFISGVSALSCFVFGGLCLWRSPEVVFGLPFSLPDRAGPMFCAGTFFCSLLFLVFFHGAGAAADGYFLARSRGDKGASPVFSFGAGLRRLALKTELLLRGTGLLLLLELPALLVLPTLLRESPGALRTPGGVLLFVLGVSGGALFLFLQRRFEGASFLLLTLPELSPREALQKAARENAGRLLKSAAFALQILPWRFCGLLLLPLPFVKSYVGLVCALRFFSLFGPESADFCEKK